MSEQLDHTDEPTLADFRQWLDRAVADIGGDDLSYQVALKVVEEFTQVVTRYKQRER